MSHTGPGTPTSTGDSQSGSQPSSSGESKYAHLNILCMYSINCSVLCVSTYVYYLYLCVCFHSTYVCIYTYCYYINHLYVFQRGLSSHTPDQPTSQRSSPAPPAMVRCSRIMQFLRDVHPTLLSTLEGIVDQVSGIYVWWQCVECVSSVRGV